MIAGFFITVLGAIIGSFAGVVAERLFTGESWMMDRSRCNSCARELSGLDLVPVLSWLVFSGRCRSCGSKIPVLYAIVEGTLAVLFLLSYLKLGLSLSLLFLLVFLGVLMVTVLYDLRHTIVPPGASALLIVLSLGYAFISYPTHALGLYLMIAGGIGLAFTLFFLLSGGRAMGLGDAPIAFALSLLVGSQAISGLLFSFWIGAAVGIVILVTRPKGARMGIEVPFVPFMAAGFLLAFFTLWNPLGLLILQ